MKKALAFLSIFACVSILAVGGRSQTNEFRTLTITTTADAIIDSSLTAEAMGGKRLYINGIFFWYDNAANTNQIGYEIVRGQSAMATQGLRRETRYTEAMTSGGIKGTYQTMNITTGADSTMYFALSATGSDSLLMIVSYKFVGK